MSAQRPAAHQRGHFQQNSKEYRGGRLVQHLLGTVARNIRLDNKSPPYHFSDSILGDPAFLAIIGFEPIEKLLGAFARIAREAASGDVFPIDYSRVVNDVFPRCYLFSSLFG